VALEQPLYQPYFFLLNQLLNAVFESSQATFSVSGCGGAEKRRRSATSKRRRDSRTEA
jgi:hypothetical protein